VIYILRKNFSTKIAELRKAAGLKQSELGQAIGLSHDAISDIERGKRATTFEMLGAFAQYFNVSTDYLLGLDDVPNRRDANNH
jgi:transcriptional regulator with XRE-family HTH domain